MSEEKLAVIYKGKTVYYLNPRLIKKQGVSPEKLELIKEKHIEKLDVFEKIKIEESKTELRSLALSVERIEFELQELWGFEKNKNMHEWYLVPKCTCPKFDNADLRGSEMKIINKECPIHGS